MMTESSFLGELSL